MERMWLAEARMKYPKQWIVAVNITYDKENKAIGDIHLVTSDMNEAYDTAMELKQKGDVGKVAVTEGFNDTPCIGGLEIWNL